MRIESIKLKNFRCFENLEIAFHPQLTVIVGKNASGKSTVLEAAAIAAGSFSCFYNSSNYGIKRTDAHLITNQLGSMIDNQQLFPVSISASAIIDEKRVTWTRQLSESRSSEKPTNGLAKELLEVTQAYRNRMAHGDTELILPMIAYYDTGRLWKQPTKKSETTATLFSRTNGYIDSLGGAVDNKLLMTWFMQMSMKKLQNLESTPEYDAVCDAIRKCVRLLMNTKDTVDVAYTYDIQDICIYYQESNHTIKMPLSRMSDGYKCTIHLIADIAYRMAQLNPQLRDNVLNAPGVVIIDEIDLHLHPEWQKRILGDLTSIFPNIQFIVSTHASSVISSVRSENLVILENNNVSTPVGEVYGKDSNTIHSGVMGSTERPDHVKNLFSIFYDALKNNDIEKAKSVITEIEKLIGTNDPELAACHTKLTLAELKAGRRND